MPMMDSALGCMYGQIIGDALGLRYEFLKKENVEQKLKSDYDSNGFLPILGGGIHRFAPGQISDDTEMALSLARSLDRMKKFDETDVICSYANWMQTGPKCAGRTTRNALSYNINHVWNKDLLYENDETIQKRNQVVEIVKKNTSEYNQNSLSNGSLMRISPLAIRAIEELKRYAWLDASITHVDERVKKGAQMYTAVIASLIRGSPKEAAFEFARRSIDINEDDDLWSYILGYAQMGIKKFVFQNKYIEPDSRDMGLFCIALQNALYQLLHAKTFYDGIIETIKLGGDTDTNAAIAGSILGARFGYKEIPQEWITTVMKAEPVSNSWNSVRIGKDLSFLSAKDAYSLTIKLFKE